MIEVKMQPLTETMLEGTVARWSKVVGEAVEEGEPLLEVETDKTVTEVNSPASGIVAELLWNEGDSVAVGDIIALIRPREPNMSRTVKRLREEKPKEMADSGDTQCSSLQPSEVRERILATPAARRVAKEKGIALRDIAEKGFRSPLAESDVIEYATLMAVNKTGGHDSELHSISGLTGSRSDLVIPLDGIRKVIAEKMAKSRGTAADVTTVMEVDVTELMQVKGHLRVSVTAFIVRAAALGLREYPILNSSLVDDTIVIKRHINIGVAVDSDYGLVVPVVHDADSKSLQAISSELRTLALKARERKATINNLSGGTFTITNSGVLGSCFFTPIINYPETAILGVGAVRRVAAVIGDEIAIRSMMYLCLSYDHRVIDGSPAVQFLARVRKLLEDPGLLESRAEG